MKIKQTIGGTMDKKEENV